MSIARNNLVIFERQLPPLDNFGSEKSKWCEVCKAFVSLEPLTGRELINAQQVQSQTTHKLRTFYTPGGTNKVTSSCRAKLRKPALVDESRPDADCNFRIFNIESVVNVKEMNRELEMMVVESV